MSNSKFIDIVQTMIEWGLIDRKRIMEADYVAKMVCLYIESANMARETLNMKTFV